MRADELSSQAQQRRRSGGQPRKSILRLLNALFTKGSNLPAKVP
jgi:hypothetical protein